MKQSINFLRRPTMVLLLMTTAVAVSTSASTFASGVIGHAGLAGEGAVDSMAVEVDVKKTELELVTSTLNNETDIKQNAGAAKELATKLQKLLSLQGGFEQTLVDEDGELLQQSSGTFILNRDGQYRWETTQPFEQLLLGDNEEVQLYDPDLEQLTIRKLKAEEKNTPLTLLTGQVSDIQKLYIVKRSEKVAEQLLQFTLLPRDAANNIKSLSISFSLLKAQSSKPKSVDVIDGLGQRTSINLIDTRWNEVLRRDAFDFKVPEGTDLINEG